MNAVLGASIVYGIVRLLGHGIHGDHRDRLRLTQEPATPSREDREQLAA